VCPVPKRQKVLVISELSPPAGSPPAALLSPGAGTSSAVGKRASPWASSLAKSGEMGSGLIPYVLFQFSLGLGFFPSKYRKKISQTASELCPGNAQSAPGDSVESSALPTYAVPPVTSICLQQPMAAALPAVVTFGTASSGDLN